MICRLFVMLTLGVGLIQPPLAARELSEDDLRMKERLIALSQGDGSVADLRIELMDGGMAAHRSYLIANGKIVKREWDLPDPLEKHNKWIVTDDEVRKLLRELVEKQYWTFEGTQFVPDNTMFLFRFYYKNLQYVDYRCDVNEYEPSPQRSAIRSALLTFASGSSPEEKPVTHEAERGQTTSSFPESREAQTTMNVSNSTTVTVSIQTFSGMPNPNWTFSSPEDIATLRRLISDLPKTEPVEEPSFGGFWLRANEAKLDFPHHVLVFHGIVKVWSGYADPQYFKDTKGLKTFLIEAAKARGFGKFVTQKDDHEH